MNNTQRQPNKQNKPKRSRSILLRSKSPSTAGGIFILPFPLYLFPFLLNEPNFAVNLSKTAISAKKYQKYIDL